MAGWPAPVVYALQEIGNQYPGDELSVEAFVSLWGGLDRINFIRSLQGGTGEDDMLLAILALGYSDASETRELLAPLLESPYPKVRWVSAYCLGKMRDKRAYHVLQTIITEFLPPNEPHIEYEGQIYDDWFYDDWRPRIAEVLRTWEEIS